MDHEWQDVEAIKQLKARYFRYLDTQEWTALEGIFTTDAVVSFPEIDVSYPSGAAFVAFARSTMEGVISVHVGYMPEITLTGAESATGVWGMTDDLDAPGGMPQSGGKPVRMQGAGHYHEEYRKIDGEWKIAAMRLKRLRLDID